MQYIDIATTQNVTIEYELASTRERILSFVIDLVILWVMLFFTLLFSTLVFPGQREYIMILILIPLFFFYSLLSEYFQNGRSWGKKIVGLRIVRLDGADVTLTDCLVRWSFRLVDFYFSIGSLAAFLVSSSTKSQRLGDIIANTTVIKFRPRQSMKMLDVLRINSLKNYTPVYPAVKSMMNEEILFLKNLYDRYKQFPNEAHEALARETCEIVKKHLNINEPVHDPLKFIQTLILDYVVLTR